MIWKVSHLWNSVYCFILNYYHHWSLLILRNGNGTAIFLHIRKGVTQGGLLAMVLYGLGILLIIKNLKADFTDINQPWSPEYAVHSVRLQESRHILIR